MNKLTKEEKKTTNSNPQKKKKKKNYKFNIGSEQYWGPILSTMVI